MAITHAVLSGARTLIDASAELTAYRAATAALDAASEPDRLAKWKLAYDDSLVNQSPALRLRREIRNALLNQDLSALSVPEREEAVRTLSNLYVRDDERPRTPAENLATLTELVGAGLTE